MSGGSASQLDIEDIFFIVFIFALISLRIIAKISDSSGYLKWDREMRDVLKWTRLWKFTQKAFSAEDENNDLCCIALRTVVDGDLYHDIKDMDVAKNVWEKIIKICKLKEFSALMTIYSKFESLKVFFCADINEYDIKFRNIINELVIYSFNSKMNENWLIYKYLANLSEFARLFIDRWISKHEFFNNDEKNDFKNVLSNVIHSYEAQCTNSLETAIINDTDLASLVIDLVTNLIKSSQQNVIFGHTKVITQKIKWCDHCQKSYHDIIECTIKHPHLVAALKVKKDKKKKRRQRKNQQRKSQNQNQDQNQNQERKDKNKGDNKSKGKSEDSDENSWESVNEAVITHSAFVEAIVFSKSINSDKLTVVKVSVFVIIKILDFSTAWLLDTSVSFHMISNRWLLINFVVIFDVSIEDIEGELKSSDYGIVRLFCDTSSGGRFLSIHQMLYVSNCTYNLLSFSQLQQGGCSLFIIFNDFAVDNKSIRALRQHDLYVLQLDKLVVCLTINQDTLKMWHERLNHLNIQNIIQMTHQHDIDFFKSSSSNSCILCERVSDKTESHRKFIKSKRHVGDLIHDDLMSLFSREQNDVYWIVIWIDDFTQMFHVNILYDKTFFEVLASFKKFLDIIEHDHCRCTRLRIDNDDEFFEDVFAIYREKRDIRIELSTADNSQMNECAERLNQTLMRKINTFLKNSELFIKWWFELINSVNHIRNALIFISVTDDVDKSISSYQKFIDHVYFIERFRRIDQEGEYLMIKFNTEWKKFQDHRQREILIEYDEESIYRMIIISSNIYRFFNVEWLDNKRFHSTTESFAHASRNEIDIFLNNLNVKLRDDSHRIDVISDLTQISQRVSQNNAFVIFDTSNFDDDFERSRKQRQSAHSLFTLKNSASSFFTLFGDEVDELNVNTFDFALFEAVRTTVNELERALKQHSYLRSRRDFSVNSLTLLTQYALSNSHEFKIYNETMTNAQHKMDWQLEMNDEMQSHRDNETWKLVSFVSQRRKVLSDKWIYKVKRKINEEMIKYKARWCVRGFEQREDLDYHEIFSIVIKSMSYKVIFVIVAANDWDIEQMNVKIAFLYEDIDEEIYVEVSHEYIDFKRKMYCRLRKVLYELKQSSRIWFNTLISFLKEHDFLSLNVDQSVFFNDKIIIAIYVDDLLIVELNKKFIQQVKQALSERFQMTDMSSLVYYLDMNVTRDRQQRTLCLSQKVYLEKILRDHEMWNFNYKITFMNVDIKLESADSDYICSVFDKLRYQFAVDFLMYAMLEIRLDIAYAISVVSRYASNLTEIHWKVVTRIFKYLRHFLDLCLIFSELLRSLTGYIDVDWTDDKKIRRSIFDYIFNLDSEVISWSFKRQVTVALSICEAEYMSQIQTVKEVIWLSSLLNELQLLSVVKNNLVVYGASVYCLVVTIIYCDNQEAQALARNLSQHVRSKHIDIQQHFVRDKMQNDTLNLQHVFSDQQIVDDLTKPLFKNRFLKFRRDIDLMWSKNAAIWYFLDKSFLLNRSSGSLTRIHFLKKHLNSTSQHDSS